MRHFSFALIVFTAILYSTSSAQVPQKISYQGLLTTPSGTPVADGNYDLKFEIFNQPSAGDLRHTETHAAVPVQKGTFSLALGPFPTIFNESLYVQVTVTAGPGSGWPLTFSPRSELTSAPYALQSASLLGPNSVALGIGAIAGGSYNRARAPYATVNGGGGPTADDSNSVTGGWSTIGGGLGNKTDGYANTIGGGRLNTASNLVSTIAGGEANTAIAAKASIGGGQGNMASGSGATVGGGIGNLASFIYATVGGGTNNKSISYATTVGGGGNNNANGFFATVGGGDGNSATNQYATVPGGRINQASGAYSFAAGQVAKALHNGTFVWSDGADFGSTGDYQFLIHAAGGVGIGTNSPQQGLSVDAGLNIDQSNANNGTVASALTFGSMSGEGIASKRNPIGNQFGLDFFTASSIRMSIRNGGNVGIGTSLPAYKLEVNGDINAIGTVRSNGIALTSDVRFKKNISTLSNALTSINELRGVTYYWKSDEFPDRKFNNEKQIGFIAQELEKIYPELVSIGADGYEGVDYARLTPILVEAIKEQQTEIDELRAVVNALVGLKKDGAKKSLGELK